jgi:NTP pyrophosphatase (non-canonical NTP hydrolase)
MSFATTEINEDAIIKAYADAHGCPAYGLEGEFVLCGERYKEEKGLGVRPLPCVRDEHGEIQEQTIKELLLKINEELDELKEVLAFVICTKDFQEKPDCENYAEMRKDIAEEAADTITAITTMLEALGIDAEMRDEAIRRVNEKNRERGRL